MPPTRRKAIALLTTAAGLGIVLVAGATFCPPQEKYWIWKLGAGTEEERQRAAERLGDVGSVKAIPHLIETAVTLLDQSAVWWVDMDRSELYAFTKSRRRHPWPYVAAIQSISNRTPERTKEFLQPYLSDDRENARAVAASVLFYGTDRAREYVSRERLGR